MVLRVDRSIDARKKRTPDVFLSHSSRDKAIVRQLAEDLCYLQVDAFLDEWELQPGDSLSDVIGFALEKSRYVAVVLGNNFSDSRWARDEMNQALAREKRANGGIVLPLLCGNAEMPAFLENKVYLDLRENGYYPSLVRLAAMVHQVSRQRVEYALQLEHPETIGDCIHALRYCGVDPFVILDASD